MDIKIVAVFEPEDAAGCHEKGAPELVVYDVPRVKVQSLAALLNYASTRTLSPNETIQRHGLIMVTKAVKGAALKPARAIMLQSHPKAKVIELLPGVLGDTAEDWGDANIVEEYGRQIWESRRNRSM